MKFCNDCGRTGSVWGGDERGTVCKCGSIDVRPLSDQIIDLEFMSIIESAFTPFDRHVMEAIALTIEEE